MKSVLLLVAIFLLFGYLNSGFCENIPETTVANENIEYLGDEYIDNIDYEDNEEANKSDAGTEDTSSTTDKVPFNPPYFEQPEAALYAKPGEDVLINCDVRNFQLRNVIMWYKGIQIIATGQHETNHNRVEVMKNYSIRIKHVRAEDAGDYYCEVLPEKIRFHATLKVIFLAIFCDGREATNRAVTFLQGESHTLECTTYGADKAKIKWSLNGQRAETLASTKINGNKIVLHNIDDHHGGLYQCLADDGTDDPPHGLVTIDVQYAPKVFSHRRRFNTDTGHNAELHCDYKANPIAVTRWTRNGKPISFSEKYSTKNTMHHIHNRTVLTVKDVNATDLGAYQCQIENAIGTNVRKVELTFKPEDARFEKINIDGNKVILCWLVRSLRPLSEASLNYKISGAHSWSAVSVSRTERHSETDIWKITHELELLPGNWSTRVKTSNSAGWSDFSEPYNFTIIDDKDSRSGDTDLEPKEGIPAPADDMVMAAGIGVGKKNNNGANQINNLPSALHALMFLVLARQLF